MVFTPAACSALRRAGSAPSRCSSQSGCSAAPRTSLLISGVRRWLSMTMRTKGALRNPSIRQVSSGSSASTVPTPTSTASCRPRIACAARRADSPVSHCDSPRAGGDPAIQRRGEFQPHQRPSLRDAHGETGDHGAALLFQHALVTEIPAARRRTMPAPLTLGCGSVAPTTTRATPASISASVQGGVFFR